MLNPSSTFLCPSPQITLTTKLLLNLNWCTQEYSSEVEWALCIFSGMPCFIQFARQLKLPESDSIWKTHYRAFSEFGCTKICLRAGILQNCDSLLIKSHLQMHSYYTVDVFKPKNDHPGSKQVSVRAALCLVSSGSCSQTHPWSGGEAAQGDTGTHHLGRDGIY